MRDEGHGAPARRRYMLRPVAQAAPAFADDHLAGLALRGQPAALAVLAQRRLGGLSGLRPAQRETLLATLYPIDPAVVQDVD